MRIESLLLAAAMLTPALAGAAIDPGRPALAADTPARFAEQVSRVRDEMKPGGRYEFIREDDRRHLERLLLQMAALFGRYDSVGVMSRDARVELFNAQEEVNGILRHNDEQRLVCERRPKIGSNIPETTCRTVGDIERDRRAGNRTLLELNNSERHQTASDRGDRRGGS